jgi:nucleoprotein TPR
MAKSEEFAKYRRTKHAEFVQLQASHDALTQTNASMDSTLKIVQSAHNAQGHQLKQALARVQDLTGQLADQDATYSSEASGLRRLVSMMEEREKRAKEIVEGIEREWAGVGDRAERREMALTEEIESERRARELAEKRVEQLEAVLSRMDSGELPVPGRVATESPARTPGPSNVVTQGMMSLSPTVAMASRAQRGGKTFTEVYADYIRLQDDYAKKSAEYDQMDRTLSAVLAQIEERVCSLGHSSPDSHDTQTNT